ncbi:MAG: methyltransferase domain-containing protein [Candidatus Korobacteraceae bacterium]
MKRTIVPELLDSDQGTPEEVQASLADLRLINRCFGGIATTEAMLKRMLLRKAATLHTSESKHGISLLEVGAGSGDIPIAVAHKLREHVQIRVVLLDRSPVHLPQARLSNTPAVAADAFEMPLRDSSFDVVSCALLAHHFEPDEIVRFVGEALRVARWAVLINDLRRSWMHLAAVYMGFPLFRSRLTRHDGPASVRRAYTAEELARILCRTEAQAVEIENCYLFRMGAIVWKNAPGT